MNRLKPWETESQAGDNRSMRVLLVYPLFPKSILSFDKTMELIGKKVYSPPLGLITAAAILPQEWEFKLVDRNIREITEAEWAWAEFVMLSAMIVQKVDFHAKIIEAKRRGKAVAVGGPYPTAYPQQAEKGGAHYLVLDEGEMTIPMFLAALERGENTGVFRSTEKPDITQTPIPRYDLLELDAYYEMCVQFSRGCPFFCEFCDIITLYGRKPRTKNPIQIIRELEYLYELGWRGAVFMVDDNFIGNKRNVKVFLKALKIWIAEKNYPFFFFTEASVNLAKDLELIALMRACNFRHVFLGLETPDQDSLILTKKPQNINFPLRESVKTIHEAGLEISAGFIIGFDQEKPGAGERIVQFVEETDIPLAFFSMLQVLPNTALWHRLEKADRLLNQSGDINQSTLMNFIPTRPIEEIAHEYVEAFWQVYEPHKYLNRCFRHLIKLKPVKHGSSIEFNWKTFKMLVRLFWQQGFVYKTRWAFWRYLFKIARFNSSLIVPYLSHCAVMNHVVEYRQIVRNQISSQLADYHSSDN